MTALTLTIKLPTSVKLLRTSGLFQRSSASYVGGKLHETGLGKGSPMSLTMFLCKGQSPKEAEQNSLMEPVNCATSRQSWLTLLPSWQSTRYVFS